MPPLTSHSNLTPVKPFCHSFLTQRRVHRYRSLADEYTGESCRGGALAQALQSEGSASCAAMYVLLRAADRFYAAHGRWVRACQRVHVSSLLYTKMPRRVRCLCIAVYIPAHHWPAVPCALHPSHPIPNDTLSCLQPGCSDSRTPRTHAPAGTQARGRTPPLAWRRTCLRSRCWRSSCWPSAARATRSCRCDGAVCTASSYRSYVGALAPAATGCYASLQAGRAQPAVPLRAVPSEFG